MFSKGGLIGSLPGPSIDTDGELFSGMEVGCEMPEWPVRPESDFTGQSLPAVSVNVSLSNDGVTFSDQVEITVFDSLCLACSDSRTCSQKVG